MQMTLATSRPMQSIFQAARRQRDRLVKAMEHEAFDLVFFVSAISLAVVAGTWLAVVLGVMPKRLAIYPMTICGALGMYVLSTQIEQAFSKRFAHFESTKFLGLGALALASFMAHAQAADEINAIFHFDASAFPHALAAGTAFVLLSWLLVPIVLLCLASLLYAAAPFWRKSFRAAVAGTCVLFASLMFLGLVGFQMFDPAQRANNIYQVARAMDFNSSFECSGAMPGSDGVAFVGPDQRRGIVAPKLTVVHERADSMFKAVAIPKNFAVTDCR